MNSTISEQLSESQLPGLSSPRKVENSCAGLLFCPANAIFESLNFFLLISSFQETYAPIAEKLVSVVSSYPPICIMMLRVLSSHSFPHKLLISMSFLALPQTLEMKDFTWLG